MRILFTSDWQTDYDNLDLCRRAVDEILRLKDELGFDVLVLCGDLKHVYNPIDVRVINFWMKTVTAWRRAGLDVVADLGNHDRVGMHVDKQNWFPVLRKAGVLAYDEPGYVDIRGEREIAVLPYRNSPQLIRREASDLARDSAAAASVLVFHSELRGARYNVLARAEDAVLCPKDLHPERYLFCIGGHFHLQQRVEGNIWYCGSPFATDWGEANQRKGYLLVDTKKKSIKRVRSSIPGWYDPSWPGFEEAKPESWEGAHVRIKVPVEGIQHVREKLEEATEAAGKTFVGARLAVVPEFKEAGRAASKIRSSYPDEKKIRLYVKETLPEELRVIESRVQSFLIEQLSQVGGLQRESGELSFRSFKAENFLSYEKVEAAFEPGLCVVSGENRDWKNRSNGSGKSSFLQPIAVALFGQTFKEQRHDKWMRRGTDKKSASYVKVWFTDSQGRSGNVFRSRQPKDLRLKVAGEIIESGNRPESTQRLIEQVTGYTWETLANAIYIDQAKSHLMLTGTEAERKSFLAKLQNLERFERAQKSVSEQKTGFDDRHMQISSQLGALTSEQKSILDTISAAKRILALSASIVDSCNDAKADYLRKNAELKTWEEKAEKNLTRIDDEVRAQHKVDEEQFRQRAAVEIRIDELKKRLVGFEKLEGTCPTCSQSVSKDFVEELVGPTRITIRNLKKQLEGYEVLEEKRSKKSSAWAEERGKWQRNSSLFQEVIKLRSKYEGMRVRLEEFEKQEELLSTLCDRLEKLKTKVTELEQKKKKVGKWLSVLKYAMTVFKRDGLPAYLNAQICPELNQAAAEYSELFAQGEIQVRFDVDAEGRLDVQVVNAHGGENVEDQSEGEMKMASLITTFAVRSVAPKTNILILDEPGDGLDAISARAFARGLKKVVPRFGSILLTTHNPAILSELSDARLISVVKDKGISRVE